jgi:hypothetical protein
MVQVEIRREYAPDRERVLHALRRLLREAEQGAGETVSLAVAIRGPTGRERGVEPIAERG